MPSAVQSAPSAAPLALPPPSHDSHLRCHVLPRPDCAKCAVARDPSDASVRADFATEGSHGGGCGKGRGYRDISKKRACPLAAHAINSKDGVALLEQYERDYGVKLTNKKMKFEEFMRSEHGVERLGKPPSHSVSLYSEPRVDTALAVDEGGSVKLNLQSLGYEVANKSKPKDWYAGFVIV